MLCHQANSATAPPLASRSIRIQYTPALINPHLGRNAPSLGNIAGGHAKKRPALEKKSGKKTAKKTTKKPKRAAVQVNEECVKPLAKPDSLQF